MAVGHLLTEVVAEFFGEAFDDFRVTGAKVVLFADIVGDVEQFFLAGTVIVNQFPVAIADRTVEVDARTSLPSCSAYSRRGNALWKDRPSR